MMFKSRYFKLGQIVATGTVSKAMDEDERFALEVLISLKRYCIMDWGNISEDSRLENDNAVVFGDDRIFAVYETSKGKIWIITESDRSATTVLFPSDY